MSIFKKVGHALGSVGKKLAPVAGGLIGGALGGPVGAKIGAAVGGAAVSSHGAKKAANALSGANSAAAQEQRNALTTVGGIQQPYMDLASPAINALTAVNSGDYSGFNSSPDYVYARDQALQGVQGSAAARGGLYSGNALRDITGVASGLASQNLGNYRNALMQQIGVGQSAANNVSAATLGTAGNVGNYLVGAGDARASGISDASNAWADAAGTAAGALVGAVKKPKIKLNRLFDNPPARAANQMYG
jgi:hypothetical protein